MDRPDDLIEHIERMRLEQAQQMTGEQKLLESLRHSDAMASWMKEGIRYRYPGATEEDVLRILREQVDLVREIHATADTH
jgi:hypothetical protein